MPEQQSNFFGPPASVQPHNEDTAHCRACNTLIPRRDWLSTAEGVYCARCFQEYCGQCAACGGYYTHGVFREDRIFYCTRCYESRFVRCQGCGLELSCSHDIIQRAHGSAWCESCYDRRFVVCDVCNDVSLRGGHSRAPNGDDYCRGCFEDSCVHCDSCGESVWNDDALYGENDRPFCSGCYRPSHEWGMGEFNVPTAHYEQIGSARRFGVELETSRCPNHHDLNGQIIWECKHDCSIEGMEFVSPILYGDEGLAEIESFCQLAKDRRFAVNRACGYHAHFDVSRESEEALKAIAYAYRRTYSLWCALVPDERSENRMCGAPDYDCDDISCEENFDYFVGNRDRFEFVNWRAYLVHGSVEVRLYQGTLDAEEICNWIKIHARFIDAVSGMTFAEIDEKFDCPRETQFTALAEIVGSELAGYWADKASSHGKPVIVTAPVRRGRRAAAPAPAPAPASPLTFTLPDAQPLRIRMPIDWVASENPAWEFIRTGEAEDSRAAWHAWANDPEYSS